jgi:catechol 2,3-dioxygenase-like lactoylglutathione lyase family enzyme
MEPRISLVTLGVSDVARSTEFYRSLGLPKRDFESDDVAFFTLEGTWLALYRRDLLAEEATAGAVEPGEEPTGYGGFTLAHNVESRERVDAVLDEAAEAGAEIVQSGTERDWGGYSGYFADPDGHHWEVAWNPDFDLA